VLRHWLEDRDYDHGLAGFMGRSWDSFVPGPKVWREALRVCKPGAHGVVFASDRTVDLMSMALRLAGWEIRHTGAWCYWCVDETTEALTRDGWKHHFDLEDGTEIAAWDQATGEIRWQAATVSRFHHEGPMVRIRGKYTDQLVTPNHRVVGEFAKRRKPREPGEMLAGDLLDHPATTAWLPVAGVNSEGEGGPGAERAYILGWWLTDAWVHGDGKAAMFSQSKPETLVRLRDAIAPYSPSEYVKAPREPQHNAEHTFYVTCQLAEWLVGDWPGREIRWEVLSWPLADRRELLRGLIDGDGSTWAKGDRYGWTIWSQRPERRAIVMALASSLGWRATEGGGRHGCVHGAIGDPVRVRGIHRSAEHYEGVVWCPTVEAGAWLARRGRHVFVTGNSGFPKSLDVSKGIDALHGRRGKSSYIPNHRNQVFGDGMGGGVTTAPYAPATPDAARWSGWGSALKPAHEPWILVRKPLSESSIARNVLRKCSTAEREAGLDRLPRFTGAQIRGREENALPDGTRRRSLGLNSPRAGAGRTSTGRANVHPTVKPLAIMRWLVRLVTPPDGVVLDPFTGSGTTGMAAVGQGFHFVGCELEPTPDRTGMDREIHHHIRIAAERIRHACPGLDLEVPDVALEGLLEPEQGGLW